MMDYIVHNLFSTEAGVAWLVLKWALVVLAAGFVGQFGKAFASYLMRRASQSGAELPQGLPETDSKEALPGSPSLHQAPSSGQVEIRRASMMPAAEPAGRTGEEKKEQKAQAKQQKKALKNLGKFFK